MNAQVAEAITKRSKDDQVTNTLNKIYTRVSEAATEGYSGVDLDFGDLRWRRLSKSDKLEIFEKLVEAGYSVDLRHLFFMQNVGELCVRWGEARHA